MPGAGKPGSRVAVLLGGLNITYRDDVAAHEEFLSQVEALARTEQVSVVFSRRTKAPVKEEVERRFAGTGVTLVGTEDRQGFLDACETAGAFVVTPDSITMIAEACATGKPVYIGQLPIKRSGTRNHRFVNIALERGRAEAFTGKVDFRGRDIDLAYKERARREMWAHLSAWESDLPGRHAGLADRPATD